MGDRMIRIAVTGGAGSGKTAFCKGLKARGVYTISADELAREAVAPGSAAHARIVASFGKGVLRENGALDRKALRRIILADAGRRKILEDIVHKEVVARMRERMADAEKQGAPAAAAEAPLLFEIGLQEGFDATVAVTARDAVKIDRIVRRDGASRADAAALLKIQMPDAEKIRRADYVIENEGSLEALGAAADDFMEKLAEKYGVRIKSA